MQESTTTFRVGGLACQGCANAAQSALLRIDEVTQCLVAPDTGTAIIKYSGDAVPSLAVMGSELQSVGLYLVDDTAVGGRLHLGSLVEELRDVTAVRRYRCACGCGDCICSDRRVWPDDAGQDVTLDTLCSRLESSLASNGSSLFSSDIVDTVRNSRSNSSSSSRQLALFDVPCSCSASDSPQLAPAKPKTFMTPQDTDAAFLARLSLSSTSGSSSADSNWMGMEPDNALDLNERSDLTPPNGGAVAPLDGRFARDSDYTQEEKEASAMKYTHCIVNDLLKNDKEAGNVNSKTMTNKQETTADCDLTSAATLSDCFTLHVDGMLCAKTCTQKVANALYAVPGVVGVVVSLEASNVVVTGKTEICNLIAAVNATGKTASLQQPAAAAIEAATLHEVPTPAAAPDPVPPVQRLQPKNQVVHKAVHKAKVDTNEAKPSNQPNQKLNHRKNTGRGTAARGNSPKGNSPKGNSPRKSQSLKRQLEGSEDLLLDQMSRECRWQHLKSLAPRVILVGFLFCIALFGCWDLLGYNAQQSASKELACEKLYKSNFLRAMCTFKRLYV